MRLGPSQRPPVSCRREVASLERTEAVDVLHAGAPAAADARIPPTLEVLLDGSRGEQVGAVRVRLAAGGSLPEHAHGASAVVVAPLAGQIVLRCGTQRAELTPGALAHIDVGERVALDNPGVVEAVIVVLCAPPDFAQTLTQLPGVASPPSDRQT